MSADYYYFAPTGGRYQTVFRRVLPRRQPKSGFRYSYHSHLHNPFQTIVGAETPLSGLGGASVETVYI